MCNWACRPEQRTRLGCFTERCWDSRRLRSLSRWLHAGVAGSRLLDGQRIACVSLYRDSELQMRLTQILVINADGSEEIHLTDDPLMHWQPVWSPDSSRIAFYGQDGVQVMNADGSEMTMLASTANADWANSLSWSPDGSRLAISFWRMAAGPIFPY